jgi:hypothetical protein
VTAVIQSLTLVTLALVVMFQIWTVRYLGQRIDIMSAVLTKLLELWTKVAEERRREGK